MTASRLSLSLTLILTACFTDVVPDGDRVTTEDGVATGMSVLPVESTGSSEGGEATGGETTGGEITGEDTSTEDPQPRCGDGVRDPGEACDDGNTESTDGCDASCRKEPGACADDVLTIGEDLGRGIGVCKDASDETCEQDFASLCAPGWHLCSGSEHLSLNDGVSIDLGGLAAVGVIRCRTQGGSGHYTSHDFNVDGPDSCEVGSSRPDCPTNLGCNEGMHAALCCAPIPTCGNGDVDDPREECDDGNDDDLDACSNACASRSGSGPHC